MCKGLRPINQESHHRWLYDGATVLAFGDRLDRGALLKGQCGGFPSPEKSRAFANPRHMRTRPGRALRGFFFFFLDLET